MTPLRQCQFLFTLAGWTATGAAVLGLVQEQLVTALLACAGGFACGAVQVFLRSVNQATGRAFLVSIEDPNEQHAANKVVLS